VSKRGVILGRSAVDVWSAARAASALALDLDGLRCHRAADDLTGRAERRLAGHVRRRRGRVDGDLGVVASAGGARASWG